MPTATDPTPPVAPVTRIGPESGVMPWCSSAATDIALVNPAVPTSMACSALRLAGIGTIHLEGMRAYPA